MKHNNEVTLTLTQEQLLLLHTALCNHRAKVGTLLGDLAGLSLPTHDAEALWNELGKLSALIVGKIDE